MDRYDNTEPAARAGSKITIAVFLLFLFGFAVMLFILPDKEFSEVENRKLAQKPELSLKEITEGRFSEGLEKYVSDQLLWKDSLVAFKTDLDRLLGKQYMGGVYVCKESGGSLRFIQRYTENAERIEKNIGCINDFAEKVNVPVDFILVPNAVTRYRGRLPGSMITDDQVKSFGKVQGLLSDRVSFYPMLDAMINFGSDSYYYRTDHHWTSVGAWAAVISYLKASGQSLMIPTENGQAAYSSETVKGFLGTLYSKAPSAFTTADNIFIYSNPAGKYEVEWVNEGKISDSIIDRSYLDTKDKYAAFLGGNFARVNIKSNSRGGKVLILKDSYANAAMQFLIDQYSEITMIDMRYYHMQEKSVSELARELGVERVIMLYNMDFINEDDNFVWLD